jgi:ABC-type transport system involved in multi-copper enzyme maturation permease subunit
MRLNLTDIRILAGFEIRQMLRGPAGVLAGSFLFLPLAWLLSKLAGNAETINNFAAGSLSTEETFLMEAVKWLLELDQDTMSRLFVDHSPFVTMMFVLTAFGTPFLTMIAALDQNATDIGGKGIRFLLPRTSRDSLLLGRFLGTLVYWAALLALAGVVVTVTALFLDTAHGPVAIVRDGIWFVVGLWLIAIPFVAFMALCSVTTGSPLLSVTMGMGAFLAVVLMGGLGGWFHESLKVIRFVFPAPLRYDLMLGSLSEALVAAAAMLAYALAYLAGAGWILRKRDL